MKASIHTLRKCALPVCLLAAALILVTITGGCIQQGATQSTKTVEVTAHQPDASHIVVTYQGGPNMEKIIELETMVTDSHGISKIQSIGNRLATTPVRIQGTDTFTGSFEGKDHVIVTGYFSDGSRQILLDTTL